MRGWMRGWTLVGIVLACLVRVAAAQVVTTAVQDTVYRADGTAASGSVVLSWNAFTTAAGRAVPKGTVSVALGAGGALSVALAANAGATPIGSYYTAVFHLNDGTTSREYWVVPGVASGTTVTLAAVRNSVLPLSVAMQTVSKSYVDTAIAVAVAAGGTGGTAPTVFGASGAGHSSGLVPDPGATAGATKFLREDGSFAVPATGSGGSSAPTGAAGGDLSGTYPNPTVSALHATSGSAVGLTQVGVGTTSPDQALVVRGGNPAIEIVNTAGGAEHSYFGTYPTLFQFAYNREVSTGTIPDATQSSAFVNVEGGSGAASVDMNVASGPNGTPFNVLHVSGANGGRVGVKTTSPAYTLDVIGAVGAGQIVGTGAAASVTAGAGAGSGAMANVSGTSLAGVVTLTTGSGTSAGSTLLTVSFGATLTVAPQGCAVMARNAAASGAAVFGAAPSTSGWVLMAGASPLAAGTMFVWSYACL